MKPIKNEKQYKAALARLEKVFDAAPGTKQGDESEMLAILIEVYENKHYAVGPPDPIEAIKFYMEQKGYTLKELEQALGYKSRVSEILSRKRKLNLNMIRSLHEKWKIPLESLVTDY
ncbi:MAG: transcriptional regulator [Chitinophagales bacterium]|nr:transcriptional regulator [Chitinophagales bacterium]